MAELPAGVLAALDRVTDPLDPLLNEAQSLIEHARMALVSGEGPDVAAYLDELLELLGQIEEVARA